MTALNLTDLLASGQARRISDTAFEIVAPGYHSPQGASSMCTCELCRPRNDSFSMPSSSPFSDASKWALNLQGNPYNVASPWNIKINIDDKAFADALLSQYRSPLSFGLGSSTKKEQPMSSDAQRVVADLQKLDESELSRISRETERIKESRKDHIEENLDGVARMTLLDKSTPALRPFIVAYFKDGKVSTVQGVELGMSNLVKEDEETKESRVHVFGRDYPVSGQYYTMKRYEKALEDSNIPYCLVYRKDED